MRASALMRALVSEPPMPRFSIAVITAVLALAGLPIQGAYRSYCGGHRMNVGVLSALFADRANYAVVEAQGSRRETVLSELGVGLGIAAFAGDL